MGLKDSQFAIPGLMPMTPKHQPRPVHTSPDGSFELLLLCRPQGGEEPVIQTSLSDAADCQVIIDPTQCYVYKTNVDGHDHWTYMLSGSRKWLPTGTLWLNAWVDGEKYFSCPIVVRKSPFRACGGYCTPDGIVVAGEDESVDPADPKVIALGTSNLPTAFPVGSANIRLDVTLDANLDLTGWEPTGLIEGAVVRVRKVSPTEDGFSITFTDDVATITASDIGEQITLYWFGDEFGV